MIYIVITTVPDRLNYEESMRRNLISLLTQEVEEEYKVVVSIPYKYKNYDAVEIPEWFTSLLNTTDRLILLRDEIDYGPVTNLVFPLKQIEMDPEDLLIVCDDDHEYESTMIACHLNKLKQYSGRHAICFRGNGPMELRTWYEDGKKLAKFWNSGVLFPCDRDVYLQLPDHWHSVSYRRKFFESDFLNEDFLNETWNNDHLLAHYAWNHNFYFLCAYVEQETDKRPVNADGRGSSSYPIKNQLGFEQGGCYYFRNKPYDNSFVISGLAKSKEIFEWNILFSE